MTNGEIRVLIADDSLTVRSMMANTLEQASGFELVGQARNGQEAVDLCRKLRPDVVAMDLAMPEMDGLRATELIMAHFPTPILIVSSSSNRENSLATDEALAAGAVDILDKGNDEEWRSRLLHSLRLVSKVRVITHPRGRLANFPLAARDSNRSSLSSRFRSPDQDFALVALGGSTGGPGAVAEILKALPSTLDVPLLVVLHTSKPFGEGLATWLDSLSTFRVRYAIDSEPLREITGVVMAPPGKHMIVVRDKLRLTLGEERHSCRPSVDVLFESLAEELGPRTCACLLTGMGKDGAQGLLALRKAGAVTFAQDEASSIVYGMPREAVLLGAAHQVASLGQLPRLITETIQRKQKQRDL